MTYKEIQVQLRQLYDTVEPGHYHRLTIQYFYRKTTVIDCMIYNKKQHSEALYSLFCVYEDGTGGYEWLRPSYDDGTERTVIAVERLPDGSR